MGFLFLWEFLRVNLDAKTDCVRRSSVSFKEERPDVLGLFDGDRRDIFCRSNFKVGHL